MATDQWHVRELIDPTAAIECAAELVDADPVAYSVFSTVTASLISEPGRYADARWYVVEDAAGTALLVAMHTPPHPLRVPTDVPGAMQLLAQRLAVGDLLSGVSGPKAAVVDFADHYLPLTGLRVADEEGIGVYDLPVRAALPWPVDGEHRMADESHLPLVTAWVNEFLAELGDAAALPDAEATARRQLAAGSVSLWVADGVPVAMCWASAPYGGVVRVSGVFTPRDQRGHGYASAVVAAASRRQQDDGNTCMLYTELANATSNKIYRAIGYRYLGDDLRLSFA